MYIHLKMLYILQAKFHKRFIVDKFEYKVLNPNNKNNVTHFDITMSKQKGVALLADRRYSNCSIKSIKKERVKDFTDDFANYQFSD